MVLFRICLYFWHPTLGAVTGCLLFFKYFKLLPMWENTCAQSKTYFISIDRDRTYSKISELLLWSLNMNSKFQ